MKLQKAFEIAQKSEVSVLEKKGWFLFSVLTELVPGQEIRFWKFDYFDPKRKKTRTLTISEEDAELGDDDDLLGEAEEFKPKDVYVTPKRALEIAKKTIKQPVNKIILTNKKNKFWNVVFLTKTLKLIVVQVDMETGKVLTTKEETLFRRIQK